MKISGILIILFALTITQSSNSQGINTVTNTLTNFEVIDLNGEGELDFQFDIYTLRTSTPEFRMGSSSFYIRYNIGNFTKARISNVNPRYTATLTQSGGGSSYNPMQVFTYPSGRVGVQIFYNGNGEGDTLSGDGGIFGYGERIATVTMDITSYDPPNLRWDEPNTAVVNPQNIAADLTNIGYYNGALPVELSSFVSEIFDNNVLLKWSTTSETNNDGFDIERKGLQGNWNKIGHVNGAGNSTELKSYDFKDNSLGKGTYNYRLKQIDLNGNFEYFQLNNLVEIGIPGRFMLSQNYPNPFNPSTKINFNIPYDSKVSLKVFDMSGKLVSTLIDNQFRSADYYSMEFYPAGLSSGVYFYTISTEKNFETKKMTLIK